MEENPDKKMLIAFVSNSTWSVYNFRLDVIGYLLNNNYQVLVLAPEDEYAPMLQKMGCVFQHIEFDNKSANPIKDLIFYKQLKKIYTRFRPDFIFHFVAKPNIYGSLAASKKNIPSVAVITGLGYAFARRDWLYFLIKQLYKKALQRVKEVWFLNNEDAKVFIKEKILHIEKVKVLPGEGINTDHFFFNRTVDSEEKGKKFTFLMSTRLLKSKGIGLYADAARILKRKSYNINFELIGLWEKGHPDTIDEQEFISWQKEGLIHYMGFVSDVRPFLQKADCFVFPSFYHEGVPRCLMEAASMELPVITSLNRGCKEVVLNNVTGYTCNMKDPFDLADKMERMINLSAGDRERMGKSGRTLVIRKFDIKKIITEYINTLENIPKQLM